MNQTTTLHEMLAGATITRRVGSRFCSVEIEWRNAETGRWDKPAREFEAMLLAAARTNPHD